MPNLIAVGQTVGPLGSYVERRDARSPIFRWRNRLFAYVSPFKVTQGHRNWDGSIEYLWLPINIFYNNYWPVWHRFHDIARYRPRIASFSDHGAFNAPPRGASWNCLTALGLKEKPERLRYQAEQKVWQYLLPFRYNTRVWHTGGQTDRTDGQTLAEG